jgi:hypothetical protein
MSGRVEVLRRMLIGGAVTTSDMSALSAAPQVQPPAIRRETLGTTIAAWAGSRINPKMMMTAFHIFQFLDFKVSFSHIEYGLSTSQWLTVTVESE